MLSEQRRQGKFSLQEGCDGSALHLKPTMLEFSLLLCGVVHLLKVCLSSHLVGNVFIFSCVSGFSCHNQFIPLLLHLSIKCTLPFWLMQPANPDKFSPSTCIISVSTSTSAPLWPFLGSIPLSWDPGSQCVTERTGSSELKYLSLLVVNLCFQLCPTTDFLYLTSQVLLPVAELSQERRRNCCSTSQTRSSSDFKMLSCP